MEELNLQPGLWSAALPSANHKTVGNNDVTGECLKNSKADGMAYGAPCLPLLRAHKCRWSLSVELFCYLLPEESPESQSHLPPLPLLFEAVG